MDQSSLLYQMPDPLLWQRMSKALSAVRVQVRSAFYRWWGWKHRTDSIWAACFAALMTLFAWTLLNTTSARWH